MYDVAIIGAGAAGLTAAIFAQKSAPGARIVAFDAAPKIGAKILISGGGRCNVTHDVVTADDFNGNRNAIAKVLRTFPVAETTEWFASMGVALKREETGKLFPTTDRARSVVDALLRECEGVELRMRTRVVGCGVSRGEEVPREPRSTSEYLGEASLSSEVLRGTEVLVAPFTLALSDGTTVHARRIILATGGRSVPKTGSDGQGYALARELGHTVSGVFPALVPLIVESDHWTTSLSGTSVEAELAVRATSNKVLVRHRGSMLFTHFGLSGPVVLDVSRHWIASNGGALVANFLPGETFESLDAALVAEAQRNPRATIASVLRGRIPERLLNAITGEAAPLGKLTKEERRRIVRALVESVIPVVRDRGFDYAEVTAGGVPLNEIDLATMASRKCDGLYLCGEILDVDGRIGGYNFQWAWASGRLAGLHAARS
ncbi:MAG: NAD(P)/FAD-dependent oxidoreductase [Acidobacteriota bacterium]|nr:NAD(P)/FAD-dependent oxidoreductase [Acidobacteriota bacterium]